MKYNWKQFNGVGRHKGFFNKTLNNFLMLLNLASTTMGELEVLVVFIIQNIARIVNVSLLIVR